MEPDRSPRQPSSVQSEDQLDTSKLYKASERRDATSRVADVVALIRRASLTSRSGLTLIPVPSLRTNRCGLSYKVDCSLDFHAASTRNPEAKDAPATLKLHLIAKRIWASTMLYTRSRRSVNAAPCDPEDSNTTKELM